MVPGLRRHVQRAAPAEGDAGRAADAARRQAAAGAGDPAGLPGLAQDAAAWTGCGT